MRTLAIIVILSALLSVGCNNEKSDYDAGIEAYKRGHYTTALYDFDKRANQGDPVAQFCLGYMYQHGERVSTSDTKAKKWYTRAADKGYAPAQNNLAKMYYDGWFNSKGKKVDPDFKKAEELWEQAAEKGNRTAQANLGFVYLGFVYAAELLNLEKAKELAYLEKAEEILKKSKDQGLPRASLLLGALYNKKGQEAFDRGSPKLANEWYKTARDSYIAADNVVKTAEKAKNKKVKGYAPAQNDLGSIYYKGEGVAQSLAENERWKEAFNWYKQAADQGHAEAQDALAFMYHLGEGVDKDPKKAMELWEKAAKQGNSSAQNSLASMYADNQRTAELNKEMAARWWLRAAQQGDAFAQLNIGRKFEIGPNRMAQDGAEPHDSIRIPQDDAEAYYWYSLALRDADNLNSGQTYLGATPIKNLTAKVTEWHESVANHLNEEQRNEIQERVNNWKPKDDRTASGTGFYINKHYILTNAHVVTYDEEMKYEYDEFRIPYRRVELIAWDPDVDLALLYDERGNTDSVTFRSASVYMKEKIVSFGYPHSSVLSYEGNRTEGTVSGRSGMLHEPHPDNYFQHTAPIQGGNSGGPVFDLMGNVVGVTKHGMVARVRVTRVIEVNPPQNVNFAIEFDVIEEFLRKNGFEEDLGNSIEKEKIYKVHHASTNRVSNQGNISENAKKFTRPVLCFENKDLSYLHPFESEVGTKNDGILELTR